ncbi:MAG TPA: hypothetical protein VIV60_25505 [Polyangiaceae bacterium]
MSDNFTMNGAEFTRSGKRPYQRPGRKHASGTAEWHAQSDRHRKIQKVVFATPASPEGLRSLAKQLAHLCEGVCR